MQLIALGFFILAAGVAGTLHAQGWDHETCESDAEAMETLESLLMLALGWPDPYA